MGPGLPILLVLDQYFLLFGQLRRLELGLLLLGAGRPELLELLHGQGVLRRGEVLLEVDDRVLALGHFGPPSVGLCYWSVTSTSRCHMAPRQTKPGTLRILVSLLD